MTRESCCDNVLADSVYVDALNIKPHLQNQIRYMATFDSPFFKQRFYRNICDIDFKGGDEKVSQKKNPDEYQYGKPCEDHLGNKYKTIKVMCEHYGIPDSTYQTRKRQGWELERILTTPPKNYIWHSPHRNMGIPITKSEKEKYKNYKETPSSRLLPTLEGKYQKMAEQFRNDGCDEYTVEKFIRQEMEMDEFKKGEGTTDIEAIKLWNSYSDEAK